MEDQISVVIFHQNLFVKNRILSKINYCKYNIVISPVIVLEYIDCLFIIVMTLSCNKTP